MPETKDKTLEEIDAIFERPTRDIVAENVKNITRTLSNVFSGRWGRKAEKAPTQPPASASEKSSLKNV